jgi:DNA-binding transcriptional ArsR family regulator
MDKKHKNILQEYFNGPKYRSAKEYIDTVFTESRLKILIALVWRKEGLTVSEIADALEAPISRTSHHLAKLRKSGMVQGTRNGRQIRYTADRTMVKSLQHHFNEMIIHLTGSPPDFGNSES